MAGVAQARETGICWDELTTLVVNRFILEVASFAAVVVVGDPGRGGGFGGGYDGSCGLDARRRRQGRLPREGLREAAVGRRGLGRAKTRPGVVHWEEDERPTQGN